MTYKVEFSRAAEKQLVDLPQVDQKKISRRIDKLTSNPFPPGHEKLSGNEDLYRIRQEDYRVIYTVVETKFIVLVVKIGHRREVYR